MAKLYLTHGVILVETESEIALFVHYGNRILIEGAFVQTVLPKLVEILKAPVEEQDLLSNGAFSGKEQDVRLALDALRRCRFVMTAPENEETIRAEDRRLANFIGYFSGRDLQGRPIRATTALNSLHEARIGVFNLGYFGPELLRRIQELGPRSVSIFDPENVSALDVDNHPRIFKSLDSGQPRAPFLSRDAGERVRVSASVEELVESSDILIGAATWYDRRALLSFDAVCRASGKKWLSVLQDYFGGTVGPCFGVAGGPCFNCLQKRRDSTTLNVDKQRAVESYFEKHRPELSLNLPFFSDMLANAASVELFKVLTQVTYPRTYRGIYEMDFLSHREEYSEVLASPYCEVCSPLHTVPPTRFHSEL